jgi:hypothetical protein
VPDGIGSVATSFPEISSRKGITYLSRGTAAVLWRPMWVLRHGWAMRYLGGQLLKALGRPVRALLLRLSGT